MDTGLRSDVAWRKGCWTAREWSRSACVVQATPPIRTNGAGRRYLWRTYRSRDVCISISKQFSNGVGGSENKIQLSSPNVAYVLYILQGFRVVQAEECWYKSLAPLMAEVRAQMGSGPVYLSFDIDALDPGFAPGTGTPEIAGLTPIQVNMVKQTLILLSKYNLLHLFNTLSYTCRRFLIILPATWIITDFCCLGWL